MVFLAHQGLGKVVTRCDNHSKAKVARTATNLAKLAEISSDDGVAVAVVARGVCFARALVRASGVADGARKAVIAQAVA